VNLREALDRFLANCKVRNYSIYTLKERRCRTLMFISWAEERGIYDVNEVSRATMLGFQRFIAQIEKKHGGHLAPETQINYFSNVSYLFSWLLKEELIELNPASDVDHLRVPRRLPKAILSHPEIELMMNEADVATSKGVRDRAIMELFYSTGLRRFECFQLKKNDVDLDRAQLFVRLGKGQRDRVVPIGERAIYWVERYLADVRCFWEFDDVETLFLDEKGHALGLDRYSDLVRFYREAAGVKKPGACHLFRHSAATAMLEGGADVRFIQEFLGHSSLKTTQIYTRVSIEKLKAVHAATHPSAFREPAKKTVEK